MKMNMRNAFPATSSLEGLDEKNPIPDESLYFLN